MEKYAVTGNIACGKSLASKIIKELGFPIVDCDDIIKALYESDAIIKKIDSIFPQVITGGQVDLKKLSEMLFSEKENKLKFEELIYPHVIEKFNKFIDKNSMREKVFVIVPLLFEAKMEKYFDKIILILADEDIRKERLMKRKTILSDFTDLVLKSQIPQEEKVKKCDYVVENNGSIEEFKNQLVKILE